VRVWHRVPGEAVDAPSLEVQALGNLVWCPWLWQGVGTRSLRSFYAMIL